MAADEPGNDGEHGRIEPGSEQATVAHDQMPALLDRIDRLIASIDSLTEAANRLANAPPNASVRDSRAEVDRQVTSDAVTDGNKGLSALRRQRQQDDDLVYGSRDREQASSPGTASAPRPPGKGYDED